MEKEAQEAIHRSKKKRIFYISNSVNINTGYSKCTKNICGLLGKDYEVMTIGDSFVGEAIKPEGVDYFIFPLKDNGTLLLQHQINLMEPDAVIIQDDLFTMVNNRLHEIDYSNTKLIIYAATDGETLAWSAPTMLDKADEIVAMTNHGKSVIEKHGFEDVDVIYHGVDVNIFKPLTDKEIEKARAEEETLLKSVWGIDINLKDKCIFYAMGRNTLRKDMFNLLRAFANFAKDKDDVVLLINSINYNDVTLSISNTVTKTLPVLDNVEHDLMNKKIILHPAQSFFRGEPEQRIAKLAGMVDAHVTAARGEGFGLGILESFACGVPVISSEATTPKELVGEERGLLAKTIPQEEVLSLGVAHFVVDYKDFQKQLETFYRMWKDEKVRETFRDNCIKFAKEHTWENKVTEWKELIERVTSS